MDEMNYSAQPMPEEDIPQEYMAEAIDVFAMEAQEPEAEVEPEAVDVFSTEAIEPEIEPEPESLAEPTIISFPPGISTLPAAPYPDSQRGCPAGYTRLIMPYGWDYVQILERYGVSYNALVAANPGLNIQLISPGTTVCIPPAGSRGLCSAAQGFTYIIGMNDSLSLIAAKYQTTVGKLLRANPGLSPQDFVENRVICVPR
ncbi:MAG: LysM peptidoglycan-binding domain-containing protein [Oscillospiraceae bacterium]|jgi:hypothetical protein|nr:LysM peptidoglycan-binding domain-containing protein [Oscillospiraceae bacterium]